MKLIMIRHGDPDYINDSLTEKGWREAALLAERIAPLDVKDYYVSTMGRAKDTASLTLKKAGRTANEVDWLREFMYKRIHRPDAAAGETKIIWDWLPADWTCHPEFYDSEKWYLNPIMAEADVYNEYKWVIDNFDEMLAEHGYVRNGMLYDVVNSNNDAVVLFCHFGIICVMLSHLLNISPMILWHNFCALPTSVTTLVTEERRPGTAIFRISSFGDISHLSFNGEKPSFSARFCECYDDGDRRD